MIGQGYFDTLTPPVMRRNILEGPAWYTAYTPYQPEISQGRLEALLNFQTMVADLTGLEVANASMLDEGTAAAEAMTLMHRASRGPSNRLDVDVDVYRQTAAILATRAEPLGIEVVTADLRQGLPEGDFFGVIAQLPGASGALADWSSWSRGPRAWRAGGGRRRSARADAVTPPGEIGADVAFGTTQRFGVPMGFGGPHAGYLAVHAKQARQLPGRLVGVSVDADGAPAYRLALQTREQHIRRDKATSNICTAQVLLAVMAAMYASYHGADGLAGIARRVHGHARAVAAGSAPRRRGGARRVLRHSAGPGARPGRGDPRRGQGARHERAAGRRDHVSVSCDEATTVVTSRSCFGVRASRPDASTGRRLPRTSDFLTHPAFTRIARRRRCCVICVVGGRGYCVGPGHDSAGVVHDEAQRDRGDGAGHLAEFAKLHPFAPATNTPGCEADRPARAWLAEITGYDAVSLSPTGFAGRVGRPAGDPGLPCRARGADRDVCLIPSSAHGTNAASAVMAGMRVVVVACRATATSTWPICAKVASIGRSSAIMVTYPSTHGVYERGIADLCAAVHDAGGQVYVDGANLNALVGLARPGRFGGDVKHLNLHKTFCIPHGGGGPGVGPGRGARASGASTCRVTAGR